MLDAEARIADGIHASFDAVCAWIATQPNDRFEHGPEGRWTMGQHLDHLIRSARPLTIALRLPKPALVISFGASTTMSRSYDEIAAEYEGKLKDGAGASGRFVPKPVRVNDKPILLRRYQQEADRLSLVIKKWDEESLDSYALPHPILGKLTVREMLYFTIHHNRHHLETLKRDYG